MSVAPVLGWRSSSRTDIGVVRQINEDACLDRPDIGLWAVADGMGGHTAGDVASARIVEALGALDERERLGGFVEDVERTLVAVNQELREMAVNRETATVGSTVAALAAREAHAVCLWVGDSRIYRCRAGRIEQVSQDHALVEELVEKGVLTRQQAASHPHGNLVTRAIGATDRLALDVEIVRLEPGDVFVLCSDGLDKEVDPEEIAGVIAYGEGPPFADTLVELALSRGSRDNVTVVTVEVVGAGTTAGDGEDTIPGAGRPSSS